MPKIHSGTVGADCPDKMNKLLGIALALVALGTAGCAQNADLPPEEPTTGTSAQEITISEESETSIAGTFIHADTFITFSARMEAPVLSAKLVVNGAEIEFKQNIVESTLDIDGHSSTLMKEDTDALHGFEKAFEKLGAPTKMRDAFFKLVSLTAGAPRGTTLTPRRVVPKRATVEQDRGYCDSDDGITYLCGCNSVNSACSKTWIGYGGPEGNNPIYRAGGVAGVTKGVDSANYGGYVAGCASTPVATHEHEVCEWTRDSSYHGRVTWSARCGWSASECEGRCGAGCPNSYNFYVTKDCLDHDVCLNSHPGASATSTFGDCGNEFDRASGDFAYGTGSGFASGCGSWMVGENSR